MLFKFFEQVRMTVGKILCQAGHFGYLGLHRFKTSTDKIYGVRGLAVTVNYVSEEMPYFALSTSCGQSSRALGFAAMPLVSPP